MIIQPFLIFLMISLLQVLIDQIDTDEFEMDKLKLELKSSLEDLQDTLAEFNSCREVDENFVL